MIEKWLWPITVVELLVLLCLPALAACPTASITNGTPADATQVMTWFNCKAPLDAPSFTGTATIGSAGAGSGALAVSGTVNTMQAGTTNVRYNGSSPSGVGWNFIGSGGWWALRSDTNNFFNIDMYHTGSPITALAITQTGGISVVNSISSMGGGNTNVPYDGHSTEGGGWNFIGSNGYWALRTANDNSFNVDIYNRGSPEAALTVSQYGGMAIASTLSTMAAGTSNTAYNGSATEGVGLNFIGSSGWWALRTATDNSFNLDIYSTHAAGITVLQNGAVGVGTSSPQSKLQVAGATTSGKPGTAGDVYIYGSQSSGTGSYAHLYMDSSAAGRFTLTSGGGSASTENTFAIAATVQPFSDNTYSLGNPSNRWRDFTVGTGNVVFGGRLGIGTSSPAQPLDVSGTIRQSTCTIAGTLSANSSGDIICTSDARLKNIRGDYSDGLKAILHITPKLYSLKPTKSDPVETFVHAGFIAQDVRAVIPQASAVQRDGYYSLDTTAILAAAVNSIKELKAENDDLKTEIINLREQEAKDKRKLMSRLSNLEQARPTRTANY